MTRKVAAALVALAFSVTLVACEEDTTPPIAKSPERCYRQVDRYLTPERIREDELLGIARIDALTKESEIRKACDIYAGDDVATVKEVADAVLSQVGRELGDRAMGN